jgi:hypothetical protein
LRDPGSEGAKESLRELGSGGDLESGVLFVSCVFGVVVVFCVLGASLGFSGSTVFCSGLETDFSFGADS